MPTLGIGVVALGRLRSPLGSPRQVDDWFKVEDRVSGCMSRLRTNIEIESLYLDAIMDRFGVRTKTEAVDLALRHLAGQPNALLASDTDIGRVARVVGIDLDQASPCA